MKGEYQARIYNKNELLEMKIDNIDMFKYCEKS